MFRIHYLNVLNVELNYTNCNYLLIVSDFSYLSKYSLILLGNEKKKSSERFVK